MVYYIYNKILCLLIKKSQICYKINIETIFLINRYFEVVLLRRARRKKYKGKITAILLIILALSIFSYIYLINPSEIKCGIVLDKKETPKTISLKIAYSNKVKWIKVTKKIKLEKAEAYDVTLSGVRVKSITPCKIYTGKVYSKSKTEIELSNVILKLSPNVLYYISKNGKLSQTSSSRVITGYSDYTFIKSHDGKIGAVVINEPYIDNIRVGISNADFSSLDQTSIMISSKRGLDVKVGDNNYKIQKDEALKADCSSNLIMLSVYTGEHDEYKKVKELCNTSDRIYVSSSSTYPMNAITLKRSGGYVPLYYGTLELFNKNNKMRVINELDIEQYLRFVVPSEMPRYGGVEGYKVQAIAARTYALSELLSGRFSASGFNVTDTVSSQAYNSQPSNSFCDDAIEETKGMVMSYKGSIIDAKYYSTSCGVGAPYNEVWFNNASEFKKNTEPYLQFSDYTGNGITSLTDEDVISTFLKDWTIKAYDSNAPLFRWKYDMSKQLLDNALNKNIYELYKKSPSYIKKKWYFGIYRKTIVPADGIGNINDINITKRGKAGNALEIVLSTDSGDFKVIGENNIRHLLTPDAADFTITPLYGDKIKNMTVMPSSFFVIDKTMQGSKIKNVTIYGGGFGHGVGMSQYGVIGLVRSGKNYKDILDIFYKGIKLEDYKSLIDSLY